jgi:methylated-DNA-[protein]-cysteine S-methyltransferase
MPRALGFCLFDTAIGACGIAWTADALAAVQLPEASSEGTKARLLRYTGEAEEALPPAFVQQAIARIQQLLAGEKDDLCDLPLALEGVPAFHQRVYEVTRAIPPEKC